MARAINVFLEIKTASGVRTFDINNQGLVQMTFDRYLGNQYSLESNILSRIDITMFDKSAYTLLSWMQQSKGKLRLKYGFEDSMSPIYELNIVKFKSTFNNLGCMVAIGAVAQQVGIMFNAEVYARGTLIEDILEDMAKRNNWSAEINCNLKLPWEVLKEADETDFNFIYYKILPICNLAVYTPDITIANSGIKYWDVRLFTTSSGVRFYFKPNTNNTITQRVWSYSYGDSINSSIISLTNTIDYSFLIKGLTIKVPAFEIEQVEGGEATAENLGTVIFEEKWDELEAMFKNLNLPVPTKDEFVFNLEIIPLEETHAESSKDIITRVFDGIKNALYSVNTVELTVIGNPQILPTDLIKLKVMNRPIEGTAHENIVSGIWKVVYIKESIGVSGFQTTLNLVRENIDIDIYSYDPDRLNHSGQVE